MVDIKLDFRNTFSSISLLKMTEIFNRMQPLQIMEICGFDPDIREDLLKVLPEASYDVLTNEGNCVDEEDFKMRIRKRLVKE